MGMDGSGNGKSSVGGSGDDKGNGPGPGWDGSCRGSGRWSGRGSGACGSGVCVVVVACEMVVVVGVWLGSGVFGAGGCGSEWHGMDRSGRVR